MADFGNNLSFNILSTIKNIGKQAKEILSKANPQAEKIEKKMVQQAQTEVSNKNISNDNSKSTTNQTTANTGTTNQGVLNASNKPQNILTTNQQSNVNVQQQATPAQVDFQGPKDLPAYAGIANMSLKSWIAGRDNSILPKTESGEKELVITLLGIKGFQRQSYDGAGSDAGSDGGKNSKAYRLLGKNKTLLLLSHIFSGIEQTGTRETDILVNIANFNKLGSALGEEGDSLKTAEEKLSPPYPVDLQTLEKLDPKTIKYLNQLLALPAEFPQCLRLFAGDKVEISEKELWAFLLQRFEVAQSQLFGVDELLSISVSKFIPLLSEAFPLVLPLVLLYYPLPLPQVKEQYDFDNSWKKKNKKNEEDIIASCEIYYLSKTRGRFLIKLILTKSHELSMDIQTSPINNGIVRDLEFAISESMYLLKYPPSLADLNVLLAEEVYEATDKDEELSIVSTGPIRLEIVLGVYACLIVLNKLNEDPDPSGLIEMAE